MGGQQHKNKIHFFIISLKTKEIFKELFVIIKTVLRDFVTYFSLLYNIFFKKQKENSLEDSNTCYQDMS